jgi:hypothetical protein
MTENPAAAGADSAPGTSPAPSVPQPDGQGATAPPPLQSGSKPRKEWRGGWQIAAVVAVIVLAGGLSLWLLQHSSRPRSVALPGTLLGLSKETGPNAQAVTNKIVAGARSRYGLVMYHLAAAIYGGAGSEFAVLVGIPSPGDVMPTAQQVTQRERSGGHGDATAFPPGRAGGVLTCFSYPFQSGQPVQCSWIDQDTAGEVTFGGPDTPSLADAAARTRKLRDAIEQ